MPNKGWILLGVCLSVFLAGGFPLKGAAQTETAASDPETLIRATVQAYQDHDREKLKEYYAGDLAEDGVRFEEAFFQAVHASDVRIHGTEILYEGSGYVCVGIRFDFLDPAQKPLSFYEYYLVREEAGQYRVVPRDAYPYQIEEVMDTEKEAWEKTALYRDYEEAEKKYAGENPGYAEKIYEKFDVLLNGMPEEMKRNLSMAGTVFGMGILELLLLLLWCRKYEKSGKNRKKYGKGYTF